MILHRPNPFCILVILILTILYPIEGKPQQIRKTREDNKIGIIREVDSLGRTKSGKRVNLKDPSPKNWIRVDVAPTATKQVGATYPEEARRYSIEGIVQLRALIGVDGQIKRIKVQSRTSPILNRAAIEALNKWTFTPAISSGKGIESWVTIPFKFHLNR